MHAQTFSLPFVVCKGFWEVHLHVFADGQVLTPKSSEKEAEIHRCLHPESYYETSTSARYLWRSGPALLQSDQEVTELDTNQRVDRYWNTVSVFQLKSTDIFNFIKCKAQTFIAFYYYAINHNL